MAVVRDQHKMRLHLYACYAILCASMQLPETSLRIWAAQNVSPEWLAMVMGLAGVPWCLKPVVGAFSDAHPVCGRHRSPYILLHCVLYMLAWLGIGHNLDSHATFAVLFVLQSYCIVVVDVMMDAVLVTQVRKESTEEAGTLQSNVWICRAAGALLSSIAGGVVLFSMSPRSVFMLTGVILAPIACMGECIDAQEARDQPQAAMCGVLKRTWTVVAHTSRNATLFIFVLCLMPSCGVAVSYFMRNRLDYGPMQFAAIDVAGHVSHMLGAVVFKHFLRGTSFRKIFAGCIVLIVALRLAQLVLIEGLSRSLVFASLDEASLAIAGQIATMPVLLMAARQCPHGLEGAVYSAVISVANLGSVLSSEWGAGLTLLLGVSRDNFDNLAALVVTCALLGLVPIIALRLVPARLNSRTVDCASAAPDGGGRRDAAARPTLRAVELAETPWGAAAPVSGRASAPPAAPPPSPAQSRGGTPGTSPPASSASGPRKPRASSSRSTASSATSGASSRPLGGRWSRSPARRLRSAFSSFRAGSRTGLASRSAVLPVPDSPGTTSPG